MITPLKSRFYGKLLNATRLRFVSVTCRSHAPGDSGGVGRPGHPQRQNERHGRRMQSLGHSGRCRMQRGGEGPRARGEGSPPRGSRRGCL
jgi:hypothetical protein